MRSIYVLLVVSMGGSARADKKAAPAEDLEAHAQPLGYAEAFKVAVRTAPALIRASFDVAHAEAAAETAVGTEDTRLTLTGDYQRINGAPSVFNVGNDSTTLTGAFGISRVLPSNGTLELFGKTERTESDFDPMFPVSATSQLGIRLTQPLLRGFGPAAEKRAILKTAYARDAATLRARATAHTFAAELAEAYLRLSLAWQVLEIQRSSLESATKQRQLTEAAVRTGKLANAELFAVQAAVAGREQDLLAAELDVIARSLEIRRLLGLEVKPDALAVKADPLPAVDQEEIELAAYLEIAMKNSAELAAARTATKAGDAAVAGSSKDLLPGLDLTVEGGPLGTDVTVADSIKKIGDGYALTANLKFDLPIGRHTAKGTHLEDRATRADLRYAAVDIQTTLAANIARGVYELRAQRKRIALGVKAIELAQGNIDAELKKFELGKTTNNEIVRLQEALGDARLRHAQALADYAIARARLDAQAGIFLDKLGIKIRTDADLDRKP